MAPTTAPPRMIACSIDFETANYSPVSMCAAGLATFEEGHLAEFAHWLVNPERTRLVHF